MASLQQNLAGLLGVALLLQVALPGVAAAQAPSQQEHPRPAISAAGPGLIVGDWRLGVVVTTGTDSSNDTINDKERERVREYSAAEAKRRGEVPKNPMAKFIPGAKPDPPKPLGPGYAVAEKVKSQITPKDPGAVAAVLHATPAKASRHRDKPPQRGKTHLRATPRIAAAVAGRLRGASSASMP